MDHRPPRRSPPPAGDAPPDATVPETFRQSFERLLTAEFDRLALTPEERQLSRHQRPGQDRVGKAERCCQARAVHKSEQTDAA